MSEPLKKLANRAAEAYFVTAEFAEGRRVFGPSAFLCILRGSNSAGV